MASRKRTGTVDGGEGQGVPMGGRDTGRGPTGYDPLRSVSDESLEEDDETTPLVDGDVEEFFENDDEADRRRDPLRRP